MKYVHNLRLYRYGLYGVLYGKWGTIRTRPSHPLAVRLPRTASTRKESCTAASSGCMALKRVASEPDTRMKTVPPTAVAETWVATVRCTYPTPKAGTRTQYVYVGPWGQAALRLRYVPNAGGRYA